MAPPTALDKATGDRDAVKSTITMLEKELADNDATPLTEPEVTNFLLMVKTAQNNLMEVQTRIVHCGPADPDTHQVEYQNLFRRNSKLLAGFTGVQMKFPTASTSTRTMASTPTLTEIRLPRLELPSFDGDLQDWVSFRDMFVTAVHDNLSLSKSQKLTYLKSQLKGEAARQISSMIISDANYDIAWSQLSDRYQNDRELLFAILRRFMNQPVVQSHSALAMRKLVDVSRECIRSLDVLKLPTDHWDAIILFILVTKMDSSSKELWEQGLKDSSIPTLKSLFEFLEQRARALAASGTEATSGKAAPKRPHGTSSQGVTTRSQPRGLVHHTSNNNCKICEESSHPIYKCERFLACTVQQRNDSIRKLNHCFNCLNANHRASECSSNRSCRTCNSRHHTLLHKQPTSGTPTREVSTPIVHFTSNESHQAPNEYDTLLATCLVQVADKQGNSHTFRVLADNGSNTNYATESCIKKIGAPRKRCFTTATGLGGASVANATGSTSFMVSPHFISSVSFHISRCLITSKITGRLPTSTFDHTRWSHLQGLQLADPGYHKPQDVDMLLGAEFFFSIIEGGKLTGPPNSPVAIGTSFGWLIGGGSQDVPLIDPQVHATLASSLGPSPTTTTTTASDSQDEHLGATLRRFWEMEAEPTERLPTAEETEPTSDPHINGTTVDDSSYSSP